MYNYVDGIDIRDCKDGKIGRGVFAERDLKEGELLIVEKPCASVQKTIKVKPGEKATNE